ncbi:30S ribosomal protein S1 [Shouchella lonarensis]|uniref:SSU ribosomal protein S1P n=1 Tax=Shouchella lonarensis TaxID=1464122 RepID=A0A1G6J0T1_9BACI|nr:30S ribosomal protein S1 [Shouchella lonarensis]SDC12290.1 SSU ribosomal protein S1P [Shouchella lonarensis]
MVEKMNEDVHEMKVFSVGDVLKGKVTKVEDKQVFVDVGFKVDGIVPVSELSSLHVEKASDVVALDDELTLFVTKVTDDELILSKKEALAKEAWKRLAQSFERGEIIEAPVAEVVKGGLVVDVGVRGFIPASLVERHYVDDFSDYKGKTLRLKVVEMEQEKNKLILSQRAVLDEEMEEKKKDILKSLQPGDVVTGTVQRLTSFGAFVDVGGVDGLVHISQIAHERVESPRDVLSEGQTLQVKVLSVDPDSERVSLSIKETLAGPWEKVASTFQIGDVVTGTVKRLVSFGAFVEVAPGVEGLVHISQISHQHIGVPQEVLEEGQEVQVKVLDVNGAEKRISLSIREASNDQEDMSQFKAYEEKRTDDASGFSLGDMIGDQLKKYRDE